MDASWWILWCSTNSVCFHSLGFPFYLVVIHSFTHLFIQQMSQFSSVHFSGSVMSSSLQPHGLQHTGLPVHYQLAELARTHVHQVGDAIQPSLPLSSPSLPAFNLTQQQGLFQWVSSSHQVAKVLEFQLQHQSFQWIFRTNSTDV